MKAGIKSGMEAKDIDVLVNLICKGKLNVLFKLESLGCSSSLRAPPDF